MEKIINLLTKLKPDGWQESCKLIKLQIDAFIENEVSKNLLKG